MDYPHAPETLARAAADWWTAKLTSNFQFSNGDDGPHSRGLSRAAEMLRGTPAASQVETFRSTLERLVLQALPSSRWY